MKLAKRKWINPRHNVIICILRPVLKLYCIFKYGIKMEKFKEQKGRQYLVLFNHQTAFDQFFVSCSFAGHIYYIASEDLFSNGWVSSLIRYLVAPIPIRKQTTDISAVMNCLRVAKEGGTIGMAPEGNRTFSGKTEYINPAVAPLAKKLKLPIAFYRIEGGYGVQPRWSDVKRRGKMRSYVSRVVEPDEYKDMTNEQLYELIKSELYVNEANADRCFYHKKRAEYLERCMYVCPKCGLSEFESRGHKIECKKCGLKVEYGVDTRLKGVNCDFDFEFVNDWYEHQQRFINKLDLGEYVDKPLYKDKADLFEVIVYKNKRPLCENACIELFGDRIVINGERIFEFDKTLAVTILGRNKLNIYYGGKIYQLKSGKRFNAVKYVNIFNRFMNVKKGDEGAAFLGL